MTATPTTNLIGANSEAKSVGNQGGLAHHERWVAGGRRALTVLSATNVAKKRNMAVGTPPVCARRGIGGRQGSESRPDELRRQIRKRMSRVTSGQENTGKPFRKEHGGNRYRAGGGGPTLCSQASRLAWLP